MDKQTRHCRGFLIFWMALLFPAAGAAQTAEWLDAILDTSQVTFAQAASVVLPAAGLLDSEVGAGEAFAQARSVFPRRSEPEAPIRMGELSHLIMRSFGFSGGFMYAIFRGPRYAYRALVWRRFLPVNPDPYRTVTGEELLYIVAKALNHAGETEPVLTLPASREEPVPAAEVEPESEPQTESSQEQKVEVKPGQGISSGLEDVLPYEGEFELE